HGACGARCARARRGLRPDRQVSTMTRHQTVAFDRKLREKWREIPATRQDRMFSSDLLNVSDKALLEYWDHCRAETCTPQVRGWYQELYKEKLNGKTVADIGPGIGLD